MSPRGRIFGTDKKGHIKLKPDDGGRTVILTDTAGLKFSPGQTVEYSAYKPGEHVDFGRLAPGELGTVVQQNMPGRAPAPVDEKRPVSRDSIEKIFAEADIDGIYAIIAYDRNHGQNDEFISVARNQADSTTAIDYVCELVKPSGGGMSFSNRYDGANGLHGQIFHVFKNFRHLVENNPKQEGILFVPIEGLLPGRYAPIDYETLILVVECARLPEP